MCGERSGVDNAEVTIPHPRGVHVARSASRKTTGQPFSCEDGNASRLCCSPGFMATRPLLPAGRLTRMGWKVSTTASTIQHLTTPFPTLHVTVCTASTGILRKALAAWRGMPPAPQRRLEGMGSSMGAARLGSACCPRLRGSELPWRQRFAILGGAFPRCRQHEWR